MKDFFINLKYILIYVVVPSIVTTIVTMYLIGLL